MVIHFISQCFALCSRTYLPLALALVLLATTLLASCEGGAPGSAQAKEKEDAEAGAIPVEVQPVSRRSIEASYSGTATLEPQSEAQVVAKTSGILLKLYVEEGDVVKPAQLLAKLDDASPRLNLLKAEAALHKLENDYARSNDLFAKKLVSAQDHDKIHYELETQRAAYAQTKLELSYTAITAPIGGVISKRLVKMGNLIQNHQGLFQIVDFDPLLAVLNVPERELNTLHAGTAVSMTVDALTGKQFEGHIQRISPVVDAATGTFRVTSEFRDKTNQLKAGMFGRLDIIYDHHAGVLAVPRTSLIQEDGETAVYAVVSGSSLPLEKSDISKNEAKVESKATDKKLNNDKSANNKVKVPPLWVAQRKSIKIGYLGSEYVEILDGLKEDDRVITMGRNAVRDGTAVHVLENAK